jgi:hypothetical protein
MQAGTFILLSLAGWVAYSVGSNDLHMTCNDVLHFCSSELVFSYPVLPVPLV